MVDMVSWVACNHCCAHTHSVCMYLLVLAVTETTVTYPAFPAGGGVIWKGSTGHRIMVGHRTFSGHFRQMFVRKYWVRTTDTFNVIMRCSNVRKSTLHAYTHLKQYTSFGL